MEWQPIEMAPNREVLLYFPSHKQGHYKQHTAPQMIKVGREGDYPFRRPTHWMPLPAAPTSVGAA